MSKLIAILVTGKFLETISNVMDNTLRIIHQWAISTNLEVNADKTNMVLFTRKYKIPTWKPPKLNGVKLTNKEHAKYL